jgi:peptidylprolyl isomerase
MTSRIGPSTENLIAPQRHSPESTLPMLHIDMSVVGSLCGVRTPGRLGSNTGCDEWCAEMSDVPNGPGWWQASDLKWYPPEAVPGPAPTVPPVPVPDVTLPDVTVPDVTVPDVVVPDVVVPDVVVPDVVVPDVVVPDDASSLTRLSDIAWPDPAGTPPPVDPLDALPPPGFGPAPSTYAGGSAGYAPQPSVLTSGPTGSAPPWASQAPGQPGVPPQWGGPARPAGPGQPGFQPQPFGAPQPGYGPQPFGAPQPGYPNQPYGAPYGATYGAPPGYNPFTPKPSNGVATASLVVGIIGLLTCWIFIGGLLGLIAGILGIVGIKKAKEVSTGRGMAMAGLILGVLAMLGTGAMIWLLTIIEDDNNSFDSPAFTVAPPSFDSIVPEITFPTIPAAPTTPAAPVNEPEITIPSGEPPTELQQQDIILGTGEPIKDLDTVEVYYKGVSWRNGVEFDSNFNNGFTFQLTVGSGQVIKGWDLGLIGMRQGGVRQLIIPPDLAYGKTSPSDNIAPNDTLVFVVQVVSVIPSVQ